MKIEQVEGRKEYFSIKEIAELLGVSQSALRYYEEQNLIDTFHKEYEHYRNYTYPTMINLTEILHYRNSGVPIKKVEQIKFSSAEETREILEQVLSDMNQKLEQVLMSIKELKRRIQLFDKIFELRKRSYSVVDTCDVTNVRLLNIYTDAFQKYVNEPSTNRYAIIFNEAVKEKEFIEGFFSGSDEELPYDIWKLPEKKKGYLECLLQTEYINIGKNNMQKHLAHMEKLGLKAGYAVGEYLGAEYSQEDQMQYDYYHLWIEIMEE